MQSITCKQMETVNQVEVASSQFTVRYCDWHGTHAAHCHLLAVAAQPSPPYYSGTLARMARDGCVHIKFFDEH